MDKQNDSNKLIGEHFEFYLPQMARIALNCPPWLDKILNFTCFKWLELPLYCPPWLEKILNFTCLKWLELPLNCPPWLEKFLDFAINNTTYGGF